jgi:hypothetical protein
LIHRRRAYAVPHPLSETFCPERDSPIGHAEFGPMVINMRGEVVAFRGSHQPRRPRGDKSDDWSRA